jgi:microcystin-dependent protein
MSAEPFLGEIQLFALNYAPKSWAMCNGQLLPINQNQALFALLGTTYGGNGQTTFALPDLRGRAPLHEGNSHPLGQSSGAAAVTITAAEMPAHTHIIDVSAVTLTARCRTSTGDQLTPVGGAPAAVIGPDMAYTQQAPDADMAAGTVTMGGTVTAANSGGGQPHNNQQPYLVLNYCIALSGIFPTQG